MLNIFLRTVLGPLGSRVLDFYLEYSLWINGAILLYAAAVIWGRRAYKIALTIIETDLLTNEPDLFKHKVEVIQKILAKTNIPLENAMKGTPSLFISKPDSWLIFSKTPNNLRKLINPYTLATSIAGKAKQNQKKTSAK